MLVQLICAPENQNAIVRQLLRNYNNMHTRA